MPREGMRRPPCGHDHAVQFYESEDFLCDVVARHLHDGVRAGQPAVVFAEDRRCTALTARLRELGMDVERARLENVITFVDAGEALAGIMSGELPDEARFRRTVGGVIERTVKRSPNVRPRAYGELVDVLWRAGNGPAAIRLEELWNALAGKMPFSLLCAYAMDNFQQEADTEAFEDVLALHREVRPTELYPIARDDDARLRQISALQQRAKVLEGEIERRKSLEAALRQALEERRRTEDELRAARDQAEHASRVKSDFLAVVSHELRTPLNAILGFEDLLAHEVSGPLNPKQREYLARIRSGADQLLHVIDQILRLSRIEAGREDVWTESVDIGTAVIEAVALLEADALRKQLALEIVAPDAPITLQTDRGKLRQILLNLLSNALKFTTAGGIVVRVERDSDRVCISVTDTGEGIRPVDAERIFEPFTQVDGSITRRHGGTGLGLPVSRELARMIGGELTVRSNYGEGSVFTLRIPLDAHGPESSPNIEV